MLKKNLKLTKNVTWTSGDLHGDDLHSKITEFKLETLCQKLAKGMESSVEFSHCKS